MVFFLQRWIGLNVIRYEIQIDCVDHLHVDSLLLFGDDGVREAEGEQMTHANIANGCHLVSILLL